MNQFVPEEQRQPEQQDPSRWERLGAWLSKKTTLGFILVAFLILIDVVYRVLWGLTPIINLEVFGLLGILGFLILVEVADIARFNSKSLEGPTSSQNIPPLGLAVGSVRAILALIVLGLWGLLFFFGSSFITDSSLLDRGITAVGSVAITIVGFYFGSRVSQRQADIESDQRAGRRSGRGAS